MAQPGHSFFFVVCSQKKSPCSENTHVEARSSSFETGTPSDQNRTNPSDFSVFSLSATTQFLLFDARFSAHRSNKIDLGYKNQKISLVEEIMCAFVTAGNHRYFFLAPLDLCKHKYF